MRQSRGVCESGVFNASCSLLLRFLYTGSVRSGRQAKIHGKNLLCLSKVSDFSQKKPRRNLEQASNVRFKFKRPLGCEPEEWMGSLFPELREFAQGPPVSTPSPAA